MDSDIIEYIGDSKIQHGKLNNRVYIMKLISKDLYEVLERTYKLCELYGYTKIFAKIIKKDEDIFYKEEFEKEAQIPGFFRGKKDCVFVSKFLDLERKNVPDKLELEDVMRVCNEKKVSSSYKLEDFYKIMEMGETDAEAMAELYKIVFRSYPFPIHDKNYLIKTMRDNIFYYGILDKSKLVSLASGETSKKDLNSEMTDFATHPEYRGNGFAIILLRLLEKKLMNLGFKTFYTIARAKSYAMNITFKRCGYFYAGLLKNNTNISGNIESMNVWYKSI